MSSAEGVARRMVLAAYELGWQDGMRDVREQKADPTHPIGRSRRINADEVMTKLDPTNLLGLWVNP